MHKIGINILMMFVIFGAFAQKADKHLPKGNEAFEAKKYIDAEADFRISASNSDKKAAASYNLGNAIYRQKHSSEAKIAYMKAIQNAKTRPQKHMAFHNLGNAYMNEKMYTEAVEAYKNALRNNPDDEQTRYNYALAKQFLKDNPPPKDNKKDKKDDKKDKKDQDKKDRDKKDDKKPGDDKKDPDEKDGKDKKETPPKDQGQPKPKEGGISKQRLESLLDAVNNDEKKVQEKVNAKKVKGKPSKTEKDW